MSSLADAKNHTYPLLFDNSVMIKINRIHVMYRIGVRIHRCAAEITLKSVFLIDNFLMIYELIFK